MHTLSTLLIMLAGNAALAGTILLILAIHPDLVITPYPVGNAAAYASLASIAGLIFLIARRRIVRAESS